MAKQGFVYLYMALSSLTLCHNTAQDHIKLQENASSLSSPYAGLFSTKTSYRLIQNTNTTQFTPKGCEASQVNAIFRHGSRYPSRKDVKRISKLLDILNKLIPLGTGVNAGVRLHIPLKLEYKAEMDKELAAAGDLEMYNLGKRFQARFPTLFKGPSNPLNYKFISTCKSRSIRSAYAFSLGAFEGYGHVGPSKYQPVAVTMESCNDDPVLRFYDLCQKYIQKVLKNKLALAEVTRFLASKEYNVVYKAVAKRLGIEQFQEFNKEMVQVAFLLCAYSVSVRDMDRATSEWCSIFEPHEYEVMEYSLDIASFYKRGAAYKITYESSCPLLRQILMDLKSKAMIDTGEENSLVLRFSHAETIIPLYTLLGLYVDSEPLLGNNFEKMRNRKFKAAYIAPFSGNLAFVLFKCADSKYKIQVYSNERLIKIPCCQSETSCLFSTFVKCYEGIVASCNFKKICSYNPEHHTKHNDEL